MRSATASPDVEGTLRRFFADRIARAERLGAEHAEVWRRAADAAEGGKRLRPRLLLRAHEHLGGADATSAQTAAAAFEVLHTALLLHDDVLDGDLVRRGRPNLAGRFAAEAIDRDVPPTVATAWGSASALLAGDVLISGVHALLSTIDHPARRALHLLVDDTLAVTAAGEHADVGFAMGVLSPGEQDILRMMEQKTACYSFSAPLSAGAMLAGAGEHMIDALGAIGTRLGVLYQLRDDLIGVFGSETLSGKTVIGDLREGKQTLLVAFAEGSPEWRAVRHLFGRAPLDVADADRLRAALVASGAEERMRLTVAEHLARTVEQIRMAPLPEPLRTELTVVAEHCAERDA